MIFSAQFRPEVGCLLVINSWGGFVLVGVGQREKRARSVWRRFCESTSSSSLTTWSKGCWELVEIVSRTVGCLAGDWVVSLIVLERREISESRSRWWRFQNWTTYIRSSRLVSGSDFLELILGRIQVEPLGLKYPSFSLQTPGKDDR